MTNKHIGEVAITLAGQPYTLRPTFGAMVELEEALGCSITELAAEIFAKGAVQLRIAHLVAILRAGLNGAGHAFTLEQVGEMVIQTGIAVCTQHAAVLLTNMLSGGQQAAEDAPGEAMAAAETA